MPAPLRITGLFETAVTTSLAGDAITSIALRLSAHADDAWVEAFNHAWALTSYPRKRNARVATVRMEGRPHQAVVLFASPEDYVEKHKRHLEDAVTRANERVALRDRRRDATVAEAARRIREINEAHYGASTRPAPEPIRLAV